MRSEHRVEGINEEKCVLEVRKYKQVDKNADYQICLSFAFFLRPMDCITDEVVYYYVHYQQDKEKSARLVVEEQTCKEQVQRPHLRSVANKRVSKKNHREEYPEKHLRENQRRILVIQKYALQKFSHNPIFEGAKLIF